MLKAIFKTVGVAAGLVIIPILLIIIGMVLTVVGPLAGVLLIIFLPLVAVGVVIGWNERNKKG